MKSFIFICSLSLMSQIASAYQPIVRTYYIAAEDVMWDFAPTGKNMLNGENIPSPWGEQTIYNKVRYIEYTDASFSTKKPQPSWLGIMGPIIRAVEGDTIKVIFKNKAAKDYIIHPHCVFYTKYN